MVSQFGSTNFCQYFLSPTPTVPAYHSSQPLQFSVTQAGVGEDPSFL